ncbi:hypothetical protein [Cardiobacterium valvarum]|uniref:Uncharacterized protein n=1 Tax=Cardiobacterium valvarum F0432 TaxID=797473 RepID=G9ZDQ9_9GAMM|nr:hypothetical protein [Cardiobacterium valvarum]EHM55196.1 hypothetical protein HMPREF9080_00893 [Cardiobacterium valvarum F0432]
MTGATNYKAAPPSTPLTDSPRRIGVKPRDQRTVHSSYGHSDKMSHLDEPGLRMAHIAAQNYPREKQSLIHNY